MIVIIITLTQTFELKKERKYASKMSVKCDVQSHDVAYVVVGLKAEEGIFQKGAFLVMSSRNRTKIINCSSVVPT